MRQFAIEKNCHPYLWIQALGSKRFISKQIALIICALALLASLVIAAFPNSAFANFENLSIEGTAQVKTDASLHVAEQRAYSFDESYSALKWNISGADIESSINVSSIRALKANNEGKSTGNWRTFKEVSFNSSWRDLLNSTGGKTEEMEAFFDSSSASSNAENYCVKPKKHTYSFDSTNNCVFIFPKAIDENTVYECSYTISNAVRVYDDVAELYWTYSQPSGEESAKNVHMQIQLPVPENAEVLPNKNVYAWGHGPNGSVEIREDGVIDIKVSEVKAGQYSMVHIVFPKNWLHNVKENSSSYKTGTRLGYALAEEENWSDTASAYEVNSYFLAIIVCAISLIALILSIVLYLIFGREKKACNGYFEADKELLYKQKPALCGRLLRWNHHCADDLAYVLQKLIDIGVVQVIESPDLEKIRFKLSPSSKSKELDEIEQGALYLIFETIAEGYESISIRDIKNFCTKNPGLAVDAMSKWQNLVSKEVDETNLFDKKSKSVSYLTYGIAAVMACIGILSIVLGIMIWADIVAFAVALACVAIAYFMPRRTQEGVNLAAVLEQQQMSEPRKKPVWEEPFAKAFGDALMA